MFKHSNTPSWGKNYCFLFTLTFLQSFLQLFSLHLLLIYIVQKIISPNTKTRAQDNHISTTLSSQVCLFVFSVICYSGLLHTIGSEGELANLCWFLSYMVSYTLLLLLLFWKAHILHGNDMSFWPWHFQSSRSHKEHCVSGTIKRNTMWYL